jgi:Na+/H+ antiporter NhaD/arsenite permease-like protein
VAVCQCSKNISFWNTRGTLAGNLTITGSVANIIVAERASPDVHIGFREYFRLGLPLTLVTLAWGIIWLSWVH